MIFLCGIIIVVLVILNYSCAVVYSDAQEAKSILLSVLGSLKDTRNEDGRYGSKTGWVKYRGDQTGRRDGGGVVDDVGDDADLDKAISVLTKAVGDIDRGKASVRLNNKPEVTSSLTQLTNNQEMPANVAAIIDSALGNSKVKFPDSVADLIKSASSTTASYTNQDDRSDVARAYNSATGKTNQEFPANFADFFKSFPSSNVNSYNDFKSYTDAKVTSNTDDGSNIDVAKIIQDAFTNAGYSKHGKWQQLSNGNYFKADTPTVQNYNDFKVYSSISNPDGSNIDVNNILKNALGNAGNSVNAHNWQTSFKADTPSVQNYRDSNANSGSGGYSYYI
ncbi:uncharacterized protein LOC127864491 [Dreissena polymorpha]|uniref:Uncharacterized protein n=1 Tax=Dreissena polymorpha TaxID=45954 RepID=A0A9D4NMC5_DREPO|nr:uncharacterized protein LOC127864491 [Dreissena polymorpha]KAH3896921.1 hypothetical protein DPMN_021105 [Dreissena polymorpha]